MSLDTGQQAAHDRLGTSARLQAEDLTDFFDKWGFFWVGELTVKDYRTYHYKITQEMVDEVKSYIAGKKYKKPAEDITLVED